MGVSAERQLFYSPYLFNFNSMHAMMEKSSTNKDRLTDIIPFVLGCEFGKVSGRNTSLNVIFIYSLKKGDFY